MQAGSATATALPTTGMIPRVSETAHRLSETTSPRTARGLPLIVMNDRCCETVRHRHETNSCREAVRLPPRPPQTPSRSGRRGPRSSVSWIRHPQLTDSFRGVPDRHVRRLIGRVDRQLHVDVGSSTHELVRRTTAFTNHFANGGSEVSMGGIPSFTLSHHRMRWQQVVSDSPTGGHGYQAGSLK